MAICLDRHENEQFCVGFYTKNIVSSWEGVGAFRLNHKQVITKRTPGYYVYCFTTIMASCQSRDKKKSFIIILTASLSNMKNKEKQNCGRMVCHDHSVFKYKILPAALKLGI